MKITLKQLIIIDLLYTFQFILFMTWYIPRVITFLDVTRIVFIINIVALLEMIIYYLLLAYVVIKAFSE